jgi:hypothetical protein
LQTAEGWKEQNFGNLTINVPVNWIRTSNYHHKGSYSDYFLANGTDTLFYKEDCGMYFREKYHPMDIEDKIPEKNFLSYFVNGTVQGREIDLEILQHPDKKYSITYNLTESGIAFNCGPIVYRFETHHLSSEGKTEMLEILKTIRFGSY